MILLENRKARQEYEFLQQYSSGVVLTGGEVKSLRNKSGSFAGSYIKIIGGEAFLLNAQVTPYKFADQKDLDPKRTRKLLLKKREIQHLAEESMTKGLTLVPIRSEEHTSELQSPDHLVCRLLLEKKKNI